ncbi:hypothetical protein P3T36_007331 [Kitasatospora sp. MAP12-15]|uniref:caspase family protein n=1 Tax=unclassified Kitasatospora TaxID=2633591 RepID=UPI002476F1FC|nr:caspase family protein [Kitasatospora sp. MAP12-44]MDH6115042.1 hypothetical protein [Kitasatospora sp. MAP12-44]
MTRYLIAAGTGRYLEEPELPLVHEDVDRAVKLFESMDYQRVLARVSRDPDSADFENALSDWCRSPLLGADDVVVLYYAGHGNRSPAGQYRLACADSTHGRPRSWLSLPNLAEVLATSPVRSVLFVVDACHAAAAGSEIGTVTDTIVASRARADVFGAGTWLLASARHRDLAADGAFVTELAAACRQGDGPSQRYLAPGTVAERVNRSFVAAGLRQRAACSSVDQSEPPPFFLNPSFDPRAEVAPDGRAGADASDLSSHFEPRGRGVEQLHDPGSYFTGRERALRSARAHLAGEGTEGILVVTADPGSGKSAVLGRLVLEGHADASVNARHQTLEALVGRLAAAADVRADTAAALFAALVDRQQPFRVIVDSLDEAGAGGDKAEARRIAWELLRPLAGAACVRLVVGSRRELLPHTGDGVPVIDLDDRAYADDTDTTEYVLKIISDAGTPYEHRPETARQVAAEVARRAGRCFLVARMTASALLRGPAVDTAVPGWAELLPSDVGGAFEAYFRRLPAERLASTTALLTALAFGEGNGLPRKIWVRAATRLSGITLAEAHIDVLLAEDGSYLAHASVDGTKYFRLYHQELTDHIKNRVLRHRDLADVQECFVDTLLDLVPNLGPNPAPDRVPDRDWSRVHPYVRAHLATHAAASGDLDDLIEDASFVVAAEPSTLLPAVRHALRHPPLSMAVERYTYLLLDVEPAVVDRAALLAFVARTYGEHRLAGQAERISTSLQRVRVEPRAITPHRVVGRHEGDSYAVSSVGMGWLIRDTRLADGSRAVLAAPPGGSQVHVWLIDSPSQSTVLPHPAPVAGLELLVDWAGRAQAVTLDAEGGLRIWDVTDQTLSSAVLGTGYTCLFDAGRLSDTTPVLVCGDEQRVAALSLPGGDLLAEARCAAARNHRWFPSPGATACLGHDGDGRAQLLVCDDVLGRVTLHPLEGAGEAAVVQDGLARPTLADRIHGPGGTVAAIYEPRCRVTLLDTASMTITVVPLSGLWWGMGFAHGSAADPVLVARDSDDLLIARLDAQPVRIAMQGKAVSSAHLMVPVSHGGQVHAVLSGLGSPLEVVDCTTGDAVGSPLVGHEGAVSAVHVLTASAGGGLDILTVGNDGTARLWRRGIHEEPFIGGRHSDRRHLERIPEINQLIPWSREPGAVVSVSPGRVRRIEADLSVQNMELGGFGEAGDHVDDHDGTLNLLRWQYPDDAEPPRPKPVPHYVWCRLRPGARTEAARLAWLQGNEGRMNGHFLPPSHFNPHTRLVGFDGVGGRVRLLDTPEDTADWMHLSLPWAVDPGKAFFTSTAFTACSGETLLMAGAGENREVKGGVRTLRVALLPEPGADSAVVGGVWNLFGGAARRVDVIELAHDLQCLVPDHGQAGSRWVAQRGQNGATSVIELSTNRQYGVVPGRSVTTWGARVDHSYAEPARFLRWAEPRGDAPVLLCLAPDSHRPARPTPVVVWNPAAPDSPRRLPVLATRILWTGFAPSGVTLVAVSDEHGVALCELPGCEKVWSTPLPALVTSLTAVPGSPHLDLAVGTQQGVVLLRPQLSAAWRRRLGVG